MTTVPRAPGAGVRKPPREETAATASETLNNLGQLVAEFARQFELLRPHEIVQRLVTANLLISSRRGRVRNICKK